MFYSHKSIVQTYLWQVNRQRVTEVPKCRHLGASLKAQNRGRFFSLAMQYNGSGDPDGLPMPPCVRRGDGGRAMGPGIAWQEEEAWH